MPSKLFLVLLIAVAVFGLAVAPLLLLQNSIQADQFSFRRPLISALYTAICVLGVVAVFYPKKCRMIFQPNVSSNAAKPSASSLDVAIKGHHPDCENYSANRIAMGGRVFCAACSGLLIGALAALAGIGLFVLGFFDFVAGNLWVLAAGEILMLMGLAQIRFCGYLKVAANVLFVVGSFACLVAVDLVGQSLLADAYMLGVIVFLLWLRILLSEWYNRRKCWVCGRCL